MQICSMPQLNRSPRVFLLPDGLRKATGETVEEPAVTQAEHTPKEGSDQEQSGVYLDA